MSNKNMSLQQNIVHIYLFVLGIIYIIMHIIRLRVYVDNKESFQLLLYAMVSALIHKLYIHKLMYEDRIIFTSRCRNQLNTHEQNYR